MDGVEYDGSSGPQGVYVDTSSSISFYSDYSVDYDGFNICMVDNDPTMGNTVTVSGGCTVDGDCFYSHNYPEDYGNPPPARSRRLSTAI